MKITIGKIEHPFGYLAVYIYPDSEKDMDYLIEAATISLAETLLDIGLTPDTTTAALTYNDGIKVSVVGM
jgi:hypothetical protein